MCCRDAKEAEKGSAVTGDLLLALVVLCGRLLGRCGYTHPLCPSPSVYEHAQFQIMAGRVQGRVEEQEVRGRDQRSSSVQHLPSLLRHRYVLRLNVVGPYVFPFSLYGLPSYIFPIRRPSLPRPEV